MPRGIPKQSKAPQTDRMKELQQARAELDERIALEFKRARDLTALRYFLARRTTITRAELLKFAHALPVQKLKRGEKSVASQVGKASIALRKARGDLSRTDFAKKVGCHNSLIGHWETGKGKPGEAFRAKLAKLGVPVDVWGPAANGHAPA
jgi:DNA-binding transcriptional regulator YiaG